MTTKLRLGPKGRKAGVRLRPATDNQAHPTPLRALLPGARAGLTVRGPGVLEWLAFLEGRASR
jgi:hypothetical protein